MQRRIYLLLGILIFCLVAIILVSNSKNTQGNEKISMHKYKILVAYSTLPSNINKIIEQEYNEQHKDKIEVIDIGRDELNTRITNKEDFNNADVIIASSTELNKLASKGYLKGSIPEYGEWLRNEFKDKNDRWLGIWYDPVVFCYNTDYVKSNWFIPNTWEQIHKSPQLKVTTMDFLTTTAGANVLYSLSEERSPEQALNLLKSFQNQIVRYGKYLSTPVRMVGMGEADMSIAMQSEVLKYRNDKYPLTIVYPQDGTAYLLTGVGLLKEDNQDINDFVKWLLSDDLQLALQNQQLYFMPTNEASLAAEKYSNNKIRLLKENIKLNDQQKEILLNRWVKEVRLGKE